MKGVDRKRSILLFLFIILSFTFIILLIPKVSAATRNCYNCTNCTAEIGNSSNFDLIQLEDDILNSSMTCIDFGTKSNVTFDCQSYTIGGNGTITSEIYGINLTRVNNNTIRNCGNISMFKYGIYLYYSNHTKLTNITANNNSVAGVSLYSSSNNTLTNITTNSNNHGIVLNEYSNGNLLLNNTLNLNKEYGLVFQQSSNNTVKYITANLNSYGIVLRLNSHRNFLSNNNLTSSLTNGINIDSSSNNTLTDIIATNNIRGIYLYSTSNNTIVNTTVNNNQFGIYLEASFNNTIMNITLNNNSADGIYLRESSNNTLTNITADSNSFGIFFTFSSSGNFLSNSNLTSNYGGFYLWSGANNTLINIITNNNSYSGLYITSTSNNSFINITSNDNSQFGILLVSSSNNTFINNTIQENEVYDLEISIGNFLHCNNTFVNINGSGGRPIGFYNNKSIIENKTLSQLILCHANGSVIRNVTIQGSDILNNNMLLTLSSNNVTISNVNSSNNYHGIYISSGDSEPVLSNNLLANITTNSNYKNGITLYLSSNNTLTNITADDNSADGIYLNMGSNNTLKNITANSNSYGINFNGDYNTFIENTIQENKVYDLYYYDLFSCNNTFINITGSGGRPIEYYYTASVIENKTLSELILCNADNSTLKNITIQGSDILNNNMLFTLSSDNLTLLNINSSNNYNGLSLFSSFNNTLVNMTISSNNFSGIVLQSSSGNNLTNVTASSNYFGIYSNAGSKNIFSNMTIIDNTYDGVNTTSGTAVYFSQSHNNTIKNSQIRRNYNQAFYLYNSKQNNITNCIVENHSHGGMKFIGTSTRNVIYNNFFNSTLNYNETGSIGNFFNVTKTAGTNIVGGDYIGGNYWAFLNGTGFSETCTDANDDNICDSVYDLSDGSYDYLPLTLVSFTLPTLPGDTTAPSGGSLPAVTETQSVTITAGGSNSFEIKNKDIDIRNITIFAKENISGNLVVTKNDTGNIKIAFPAGNLYQAFTITANAISNEDLNNVTIDFRVNKTWLAEQNGTYDSVVLYRMPTNNSLWQPLTTTSIREDSIYYYFSSLSPGFSVFVILIHDAALECTPSQLRCFNDELQSCSENKTWVFSEKCSYGCEKGKCKAIIQPDTIYVIIVAIVSMAIVFVLYFLLNKIKETNKKKKRFKK